MAWFGKPRFINKLDYEQDKVQPLNNPNKPLIDKFIIFNKKLLEAGIIDKSFNITKNYGINDSGEIILIDIGELFDDPIRVKKQLLDRVWDKNCVAGCIKDKEVREYFIKEMDKNFGISD